MSTKTVSVLDKPLSHLKSKPKRPNSIPAPSWIPNEKLSVDTSLKSFNSKSEDKIYWKDGPAKTLPIPKNFFPINTGKSIFLNLKSVVIGVENWLS